jgi:uncharacterized membrane protein
MKRNRIPGTLLLLLCLGFLVYVNQTMSLLPERIATHFGINGQANGWMSRSGYQVFISLTGLGLPLFIVLMGFLCRFLPTWTLNIPHREYWLAPDRRALTCEYLLAWYFWLACLTVAFFGALHYLTVQANHSVPVHLPGLPFTVILAVFLGLIALWTIGLLRHFLNPV